MPVKLPHRFRPVLTLLILTASLSAQSLDPKNPAPLQPGLNTSVADSMVGAHFYYFYGEPGTVHVVVAYKSAGLLGNPMRTNVDVELTDEKRTWVTKKTVTSMTDNSQAVFDGTLKAETKLILAIIPASNTLVRMAGDYQIEATGAVKFPSGNTAVDPVVRTYSLRSCLDDDCSATKLLADGTVQTANGHTGEWKVFDKANRIYTVRIERLKWSLKYMPGRGLVELDNPSMIVLQEIR